MTTGTDDSGCKISRYKGHEYEVPEKTLVWQLTGKGFESFHPVSYTHLTLPTKA